MPRKTFELDTEYDDNIDGAEQIPAGGHYVNLRGVKHFISEKNGKDYTTFTFRDHKDREHVVFMEFGEDGFPPNSKAGKSMKWTLYRMLGALDLPYVTYWKTPKAERKKYSFARDDFEKAMGRRVFIELEASQYTNKDGREVDTVRMNSISSLVRNPQLAEDDPLRDQEGYWDNMPSPDQGEPAFKFGDEDLPF